MLAAKITQSAELPSLASAKPSRFQWHQGTVFGLEEDLAYFYLPVLVGLLLYGWKSWGQPPAMIFLSFMFLKNLVDMSHVTATLYGAVNRVQTGQSPPWLIYSSPLVVLLGGSLISYLTPAGFFWFLAYWSILHISRQQYGWVMMSRAKAGEPRSTRWIDSVMVFNLILYPIVYWHSPFSTVDKMYLNPGDLVLSSTVAVTLLWKRVYWTINALYLAYVFLSYRRGERINLGKLLLLLNTGLVYFGGLVYIGDFWLWWVCLGLTHGLPYIGIVYRTSFKGRLSRASFRQDRIGRVLFRSSLLYLPLVVGLALYWDYGPATSSFLPNQLSGLLFPLFWFPTLMHYYLDTFIWKNRPVKLVGI